MPRALVLAFLSMTSCGTYAVNRAALVPHATPIMHGDASMDDANAELSLGAASVTDLVAPSPGDRTAGIEVPGTQLYGDLALRLFGYGALRVIYQRGLETTAQPMKAHQPPVDGGDVRGRGAQVTGIIPTRDRRWHIGVSLDAMIWSVPYVEYRKCIDGCDRPSVTIERGTDIVTTFGFAVVPTYRYQRWTFHGGMTAREHPTIEQKGIEMGGHAAENVENGPLAITLHAGAEYELGAGLRAALILYQPLGGPVSYGPNAALLLTVPLVPRL